MENLMKPYVIKFAPEFSPLPYRYFTKFGAKSPIMGPILNVFGLKWARFDPRFNVIPMCFSAEIGPGNQVS